MNDDTSSIRTVLPAYTKNDVPGRRLASPTPTYRTVDPSTINESNNNTPIKYTAYNPSNEKYPLGCSTPKARQPNTGRSPTSLWTFGSTSSVNSLQIETDLSRLQHETNISKYHDIIAKLDYHLKLAEDNQNEDRLASCYIALKQAIKTNQIEAVTRILRHDQCTDVLLSCGHNPLEEAILYDNDEMAKALIGFGIPVTHMARNYFFGLVDDEDVLNIKKRWDGSRIRNIKDPEAKLVVKRVTTDRKDTKLPWTGEILTTKLKLLQKLLQVKQTSTISLGYLLLHAVAEGYPAEIIKQLIITGAYAGCSDYGTGWTALHHAAYRCDEDILTHLMTLCGSTTIPQLNLRGTAVVKPLFIAAKQGWIFGVDTFIYHGADVNAKSSAHTIRSGLTQESGLYDINTGCSVLHVALSNQNTAADILKLLLISSKIIVNVCREDGCTPLHLALARDQQVEATILVDAGANINAKNNSGQTPLAFSSQQALT